MKKRGGFPWWLIFIFTCFLNWASVLTAGIIVKNRTWIIAGIVYAIPFFFIFTVEDTEEQKNIVSEINSKLENNEGFSKSDSVKYLESIVLYKNIRNLNNNIKMLEKQKNKPHFLEELKDLKKQKKDFQDELNKSIKESNPEIKDSLYKNIVMAFWFLTTLAAFVHALVIIKRYWKLVNERESGIVKIVKKKNIDENKEILDEVEKIRKRILNKIKKADDFDAYIVDDIKSLTYKYAEQIKKLITEDAKLTKLANRNDMSVLKNEIIELSTKLDKEVNQNLLKDYKNTIESKQRLLNSLIEIDNKHVKIKLRLKNSVTSLKQVEYDLIKLENVFTAENKERFFKSFKETSAELSDYVKEVEKSYKENIL